MPVIEAGQWRIDYTDDGDGRPVVLIHSAVSGNRQWRRLTEDLKDHRRVLAINLFGYGETSPWPAGRVQSMEDQAGLVAALCDTLDGPVDLLGHSLGGAVALKAAIGLGGRVSKMALFEPNPFHLLRTEGKDDGYAEARALSDFVHQFGGRGEWEAVAKYFTAYWIGEGTWEAMDAPRRATFLKTLSSNVAEWDAVIEDTTPLDAWRGLETEILIAWGANTRRSITDLVAIFRAAYPGWRDVEIAGVGHMAPLLQPELVNPVLVDFLG